MSLSDLLYWYWLRGIEKIGPARVKALIDRFGSPQRVYEADYEGYVDVPGVGTDIARLIAESKPQIQKAEQLVAKEAGVAQRLGVNIMTLLDPSYPRLLKHEVAVAPPILYVRGSLEGLTDQVVAVVGTRQPSPEGMAKTRAFVQLAVQAGWQVASGLAIGIDTAGHRATLDARGMTVAVLGCGLDRVYPKENEPLLEAIVSHGGAVITEYPFGTPPKGDNLRKRNKITVGLVRAVVIAECPIGSGTLIAAQEAFDQVKPVFAFAFDKKAKSAEGSEQLLAAGDAKPLNVETNCAETLSCEVEAYNSTKVAVLFDLDGVLGDVTRLTRNALSTAVTEIDKVKPAKDRLNAVLRLSPRAALRGLSQSNIENLHWVFDQYWRKHYATEIVANPQLRQVLRKLSLLGMPMGIVTSRNRSHATSALQALKLDDLMSIVISWGDTGQHKPNPEPLATAAKRLPRAAKTLYVGDQSEDVQAARAAGMISVGVTWFLDDKGEQDLRQVRPDCMVKQPSELFQLVLRLKRQSWSGQAANQ